MVDAPAWNREAGGSNPLTWTEQTLQPGACGRLLRAKCCGDTLVCHARIAGSIPAVRSMSKPSRFAGFCGSDVIVAAEASILAVRVQIP